jgi:hypothetical protein
MAETAPDEPRVRGPFFWICVLVLVEMVAWTILSRIVSETLSTVLALVLGIALVVLLRERIWGADWKQRFAAARDAQPPTRRRRG